MAPFSSRRTEESLILFIQVIANKIYALLLWTLLAASSIQSWVSGILQIKLIKPWSRCCSHNGCSCLPSMFITKYLLPLLVCSLPFGTGTYTDLEQITEERHHTSQRTAGFQFEDMEISNKDVAPYTMFHL